MGTFGFKTLNALDFFKRN